MQAAVFYLGPMFGGKTSELLRGLTRHRLGGCDCVLVKSAIDGRYPEGSAPPSVRTHGGAAARSAARAGRVGALRVVVAATLAEVELAENERVVGVDEGQFFADLREGLLRWADRKVFVAALDGDFRRRMFPSVAAALPLATSFRKLHAVCMRCVGPGATAAPYTLRLAGVATEEETVVVGGSESYLAVCGACYARGAAAP